jgi:hypothetical protein
VCGASLHKEEERKNGSKEHDERTRRGEVKPVEAQGEVD